MRDKAVQNKVIFIALLILQILYMVYWGNAKGGYYVDEFFTFDNAHYISDSTPNRIKLYDADFMEYDKWFELGDLKGTLTVSPDNALYNDSFLYNIKMLLKRPYNWMLNYVEAVFFPNEVNKWSGILANIVLYVVGQIFLYLIAFKASGNSRAALTACAMYGFSGVAVSMVVYVRFYALVYLCMMMFLYMHVLMWDEDNVRKNLLYEIIAVLMLYLGYRSSPLAVIMGIGVILIFSVSLGARKKWFHLAYYAVPIIAGGIVYAAVFTNYIELFLNLSEASQEDFGDARVSLIRSLIELTPASFFTRAVNLAEMISDYLFGHIYVLILTAILCIYSVITSFRQKLKRPFVYVVILGTVCFYFIASVCFKLGTVRYNSYLYPMLSIVIADMFSDILDKEKAGKAAGVLLAVVIIGEIYYTGSIPRIQNLYPEEKVQTEAVKKNSGINHIVVDYHFDDRVMYECLAYGDADTKVMFMHYAEIDFADKDDRLLVWQSVNESDEILQYIEEAGYFYVEQIAATHESKVFLCSKTGAD